MTTNWLSNLADLFRPEETSTLSGTQNPGVASFCSVHEKFSISFKAVFWTLMAVLIGLAISYLR